MVSLEEFEDVSDILRAGVYALVHQGRVVYIGQSRKMFTRIMAHYSMWGKKTMQVNGQRRQIKGMLFDEVWIRRCRIEDLRALEIAMIKKYHPKYNIMHNKYDTTPPEIQDMIAHLSAARTSLPRAPERVLDRRGL